MQSRYKVVISSKNLYKEVDLAGNIDEIKVGTGLDCAVRLRKELFFESIEISFIRREDTWSVICSDNIYFTVGDLRKLVTKQLAHGDELVFKYQNSNSVIFNVSFALDFDYEKKPYNLAIDLKDVKQLCVGGGTQGQIVLKSPYVGTDGFVIERENNNYYLRKINSKYGVYLNGKRNEADVLLKENDFISLANFSFCYKKERLYTSKTSHMEMKGLRIYEIWDSKSEHVYPKFNRNTRMQSVVREEAIAVKDPSSAPVKPKGNIVMQLMPALAMLAVTVVLRGMLGSGSNSSYVLISVCTMSIGIVTTVVGIVNDRKQYKKDTGERISKYNEYIAEKEVEIRKARDEEAEVLEETYYSADTEINMVEDFSANLFNRSRQDQDYLEIRVGTGQNEAHRRIEYKQQEQYDCEDDLINVPGEIAEKYKYIENTPITLKLREKNAIGVIGTRENLYGLLKNITLDLATRHYYTDMNLFYIIEESRKEQFAWLRLLPHVYNEMIQVRNIVCDTDSKNILFEYLYKELSWREANRIAYPNIVVFSYDDVGLKSHPISRFIGKAAGLGVSFIFFEEHEEFIPNGCTDVITLLDQTNGKIVSAKDKSEVKEFTFAAVSDRVIERVVNKLAPVYCEEVSLEGTLTKNITLFELLNIMTVEDIDLTDNWEKSMVYKSMAAPLGVKAKNEIIYLDLNEKQHGPHGLVAGTTGSGKSEILQSYILSMAVLFHPYEVGFVIIDFKGGGMVNQFKNLPHLIGAITNIDGREIDRSLLSIKAELRKRQALFAEYGVNHIDAYIKLFKKGETKIPLPHLILIVDEFAELKMDQPEFMKELISAARIGRSLGVHLILATQKPSGVVDAQIWSNSKFKLCLKVQNKEDSNEVLKTPLAAEIKEPGRAYLQVGNNEIFDLFQSAYSGGPASVDDSSSQKAFAVSKVDLAGRRTVVYSKKVQKSNEEKETQLSAIVNYVAAYCEKNQIAHLPGICLPPLPELVDYGHVKGTHDDIQTLVPLGIYDDPDNQIQAEVVLNLLEGNTIIIGSSQYGKTNLLQVMLRGISLFYSPEEVNIYILDFGSMALRVYDSLHHIGGVIIASEDEKLKNFMRMMRKEMKRRKEVFSKIGITSFESYKEAGNKDIPHIIMLIDNFTALKELYAEYDEDILNICREGIALGISVVMTALQTNGLGYKYLSNFANRIALYCNQRDEYSSLFDRCRMEPKNVPGRGLVSIHKTIYEYQTYLAFEGTKEIERVEKIRTYISEINKKYVSRAPRIPELPQVLDMAYIKHHPEAKQYDAWNVITGIDYDTVELVSINLGKVNTIGITGKERFGKTNLTKLLVKTLQSRIFDYSSKVYILDDYEKQLAGLSSCGVVDRYSVDSNDFEVILSDVENELQKRLEMVRIEGVEMLAEMPLLLVIIQNNGVYAPDGVNKVAVEAYKRILKTYKNMKICFVFSNIDNVTIPYGATEMMKMIKEYDYLFVLDDLANLKLVDMNAATLRQYKKPIELGDAYMITEKGIQKQKIIHVKEE